MDSLAEGTALTLSALLGDPCPVLLDPIKEPSASLQETLLNIIYVQRPYWKCFQYQGSFSVKESSCGQARARHTPMVTFLGPTERPLRFATKDLNEMQSAEVLEAIKTKLHQLKQKGE